MSNHTATHSTDVWRSVSTDMPATHLRRGSSTLHSDLTSSLADEYVTSLQDTPTLGQSLSHMPKFFPSHRAQSTQPVLHIKAMCPPNALPTHLLPRLPLLPHLLPAPPNSYLTHLLLHLPLIPPTYVPLCPAYFLPHPPPVPRTSYPTHLLHQTHKLGMLFFTLQTLSQFLSGTDRHSERPCCTRLMISPPLA